MNNTEIQHIIEYYNQPHFSHQLVGKNDEVKTIRPHLSSTPEGHKMKMIAIKRYILDHYIKGSKPYENAAELWNQYNDVIYKAMPLSVLTQRILGTATDVNKPYRKQYKVKQTTQMFDVNQAI